MKNFLFILLSAALMSLGWLGVSGLPMLVGLVPLLVVAGRERRFWRMAGWFGLFVVLWYAMTVWWVWNATPAGPIAATFFAYVYIGIPFLFWWFVSGRVPRVLSYTVLVSGWLVGEWVYNVNQASFPWLAIGNGFARDVWAVQWYEFTGVYGGTLWVLIVNILVFELFSTFALHRPRKGFGEWFSKIRFGAQRETERGLKTPAAADRLSCQPREAGSGSVRPSEVASGSSAFLKTHEPKKPEHRLWTAACLAVILPIAISLAIYWSYDLPTERAVVTVVQPNVEPWMGDYDDDRLVQLASEAPADADFVVLPESAVEGKLREGALAEEPVVGELFGAVSQAAPHATTVVGATTYKVYGTVRRTETARFDARAGYYDVFNSSVAIAPDGGLAVHHKAKLVIGAEMMPTWWWIRGLQRLVSHLDFYAGQYGYGTERVVFTNGRGVTAGAGICYESIYGQYFAEFVRNGAEILFVITNDGWWGDTPGYRQHFDFARLRAVETRRSVVRSANTGRSGFISPRGDVGTTLGWDVRGTVTQEVAVSDRITFYVRFGDWISRVALLVFGLGVLYFVAIRARRRNDL